MGMVHKKKFDITMIETYAALASKVESVSATQLLVLTSCRNSVQFSVAQPNYLWLRRTEYRPVVVRNLLGFQQLRYSLALLRRVKLCMSRIAVIK